MHHKPILVCSQLVQIQTVLPEASLKAFPHTLQLRLLFVLNQRKENKQCQAVCSDTT